MKKNRRVFGQSTQTDCCYLHRIPFQVFILYREVIQPKGGEKTKEPPTPCIDQNESLHSFYSSLDFGLHISTNISSTTGNLSGATVLKPAIIPSSCGLYFPAFHTLCGAIWFMHKVYQIAFYLGKFLSIPCSYRPKYYQHYNSINC